MSDQPSFASESNEHSEWLDRLQDSIDGELDAAAQSAVLAHMQRCEECRGTHANLLTLHNRFERELVATPLSDEFTSRVFARIDEQENARRSAAKLQAEYDYRKRRQAMQLDWRALWQRHMGSAIAALTVVIAFLTASGPLRASIRAEYLSTLGSVPWLHGSLGLIASSFVFAASVAAASLWYLRTKTP